MTKLRQADLRQQAAGQRDQRSLFGAGRIVLDVAISRIDYRASLSGSDAPSAPHQLCLSAGVPKSSPHMAEKRGDAALHPASMARTGERRQAPPSGV